MATKRVSPPRELGVLQRMLRTESGVAFDISLIENHIELLSVALMRTFDRYRAELIDSKEDVLEMSESIESLAQRVSRINRRLGRKEAA